MCNSLVALQSGGYTHEWTSAYVLCTLLIGLLLIGAWVVHQWKFAKHPMIPHELFKGQRIVGLAYAIAFAAGMNFFSILNFFPITFSNVYEPIPVQIGLKGKSSSIVKDIQLANVLPKVFLLPSRPLLGLSDSTLLCQSGRGVLEKSFSSLFSS